jgi:non-ribosomal peptide synthase protein (TIGR01720 family)
VADVIDALVAHHDALRLRYIQAESGWHQYILASSETPPITWVDLADVPDAELSAAITAVATEEQRLLNVCTGPILRITFMDCGAGRPGRLLFIIHHLIADGASLPILMGDFQTAYLQRSRGMPIELPDKTTSFKYWCERLFAFAQSEAIREHLPYWLNLPWAELTPIPLDYPDGRAANLIATQRELDVALTIEETSALFQRVLSAYDVQLRDVLLTAVALSIAEWTGSRLVLIGAIGHGRSAPGFDEVDLSRTVGLLAANVPMLLDLRNTGTAREAVQAVKEQLRRIPMEGLTHGLLDRITQDETVNQQMRIIPGRDIFLNFLGRQQGGGAGPGLFRPARESTGSIDDPQMPRNFLLGFAVVLDPQLRLNLSYSAAAHHATTVEQLARTFLAVLRELIREAA